MVRKINSFRHLRELQTAALPSHLNFVSTSPWRFEDDVQLAVCRPPRTVQHFDLPLRHAPSHAVRATKTRLRNVEPAWACPTLCQIVSASGGDCFLASRYR